MRATVTPTLIEALHQAAHPIEGFAHDYDPLLERIGNAQIVLLGEATHGTHEFYHARAEISKRLILEKGFTIIAVEADWPDAYRVNRYIRGISRDRTAVEALSGFLRFPTWMWRNADVLDFIGWLREHNDLVTSQNTPQVGFYGLDLYSLYTSIEAVILYLEKIDPQAAQQARYRYGCFDQFGEDPQTYGYATGFGISRSCEDAVIAQLLELQHRSEDYLHRDGRVAEDALFFAEQNARVAKNAERYYRSMFQGQVSSWNLRDQHMAETLFELKNYIQQHESQAKIIVWAHNSHLGDARYTEMGQIGELNLGQLIREHYSKEAVLVGFTTYSGTVTAASQWNAPAERKQVRPAIANSYESLFHQIQLPRFLVVFEDHPAIQEHLDSSRLERAIGVVYAPQTERTSHYFHADITRQFDVMIHFDESRAVEPLERSVEWEAGEIPETFPSGF